MMSNPAPTTIRAVGPQDDLVIRGCVGSVEFVSQMKALARLSVHAGGNGAIEELNWVPALCHRRQRSTEQTQCYDGFCSGRLPPSSVPGTMTPAICTR